MLRHAHSLPAAANYAACTLPTPRCHGMPRFGDISSGGPPSLSAMPLRPPPLPHAMVPFFFRQPPRLPAAAYHMSWHSFRYRHLIRGTALFTLSRYRIQYRYAPLNASACRAPSAPAAIPLHSHSTPSPASSSLSPRAAGHACRPRASTSLPGQPHAAAAYGDDAATPSPGGASRQLNLP